jgi:hypothetical protein
MRRVSQGVFVGSQPSNGGDQPESFPSEQGLSVGSDHLDLDSSTLNIGWRPIFGISPILSLRL